MSLKIGIAADHGGFELKEKLKIQIENLGFEVTDFGAKSLDVNDDYPDFAIPLAKAVARKEVNRGIVLCGSGVGACFTVNKVKNVRAALITETYSAHQGVEHDDMNIICIGGRVIGEHLAWEIVQAFLHANYSGEARHERRLEKVRQLEKEP
jgi:ribose 5-phosphate isomerase B